MSTMPAAQPSTRVTVRSIAEQAGVSIGSVSSVLNNRHVERRISAETVEKIRSAAADLGYLPNISARRLRSRGSVRNSVVLALITSFEAPIPLVNHFIFALRAAIAENSARGEMQNFSLMIEMYPAGRLSEMPGLLAGDHFNAAIIMNTIAEDDAFLACSRLPYPVVLVNRTVPGYASVVEAPDSGAGSADLLFRSQRQRLAVLHGKPLTQITQMRAASFMQRVQEQLHRPAAEIVASKLSEEGGYEATRAFLKKRSRVDGLYAVSDALALGAYHAIKERRLRIPEDIAVVGVGDYQIAPFFDPPLACVGVSHEELARQASLLLLRQLARGTPNGERLTIPVVKVARTSCSASAGIC